MVRIRIRVYNSKKIEVYEDILSYHYGKLNYGKINRDYINKLSLLKLEISGSLAVIN